MRKSINFSPCVNSEIDLDCLHTLWNLENVCVRGAGRCMPEIIVHKHASFICCLNKVTGF